MEYIRFNILMPAKSHYLKSDEIKYLYTEMKQLFLDIIQFVFGDKAYSKQSLVNLLEPGFTKVEAKLDQV